jgi:hypothetical protein
MPAALDDVVRAIVQARIDHLLEAGHRIHPRTVGFWNALAEERRARAH